MKLIAQRAIHALYDKMEELSQQPHESYRCVYLRISEKQKPYSAALYTHFVVNPLQSMLENKEGTIYRCENGDVFILFQGSLKRMLETLGNHFGDLDLERASESASEILFRIFDLGKNWDEFYSVAERKYLAAVAAAEAQRSNFAYFGYGEKPASYAQ